jgi:hypothetical protein
MDEEADHLNDKRQMDDLLDAAGARRNARVRADLEIALFFARTAGVLEQEAQNRAPPKLFKQLEQSITRTRNLLTNFCGMTTPGPLALKCIKLGQAAWLAPYLSRC